MLTGDVPYAGLTPLQAAIGVVQRCVTNAILLNAILVKCDLRSFNMRILVLFCIIFRYG